MKSYYRQDVSSYDRMTGQQLKALNIYTFLFHDTLRANSFLIITIIISRQLNIKYLYICVWFHTGSFAREGRINDANHTSPYGLLWGPRRHVAERYCCMLKGGKSPHCMNCMNTQCFCVCVYVCRCVSTHLYTFIYLCVICVLYTIYVFISVYVYLFACI